ncbi:hypothetical protein V6N13_126017 [Hibiscus sabdariffa]
MRIYGHVETEDLWKMRRCLVGKMHSVCSIGSIELRLENWGLGEIKNNTTLRKINKVCGNLEAIGENADHLKDCEKVSILISTEMVNTIEEVVKICVGDMLFLVCVYELGFNDMLMDSLQGKKSVNLGGDDEHRKDNSDTKFLFRINGKNGAIGVLERQWFCVEIGGKRRCIH